MHITILEERNLKKTKDNIMNKIDCVNNTDEIKYSYTGKEKTPLGRGFSAAAEKIGTIMKGADGTNWICIVKNRLHVWGRAPTEMLEKQEPVIKSSNNAQKNIETEAEKPKKSAAKKKTEVVKPVEVEEVVEAEPVKEEKPKKTAAKKNTEIVKPVVEVEPVKEDEPVKEVEPVKEEKPKKSAAKKKTEVVKPVVKAELVKETQPVKEEKPKKTAAKKKTEVVKPVETEPEVKKPKKYTDYNYFMKYQMKHGNYGDIKHTERLAKIASEWKSFDETKKKEIIDASKIEFKE